jgi:hypothetical protein
MNGRWANKGLKLVCGVLMIFFTGFVTASSDTGEAGPAMLKMIFGIRAMSLGGAYVAVADDAEYMDTNPAGGAYDNIFRIALLHQEWITDVNYESLRLARGFGDSLQIGLGFTYLYLPFTHYDVSGDAVGKSRHLSQSLGTLAVGYRLPSLGLSFGVNGKFFYNRVPEDLYADQSYTVWAVDFGVMQRTNLLKTFFGPEPSLSFGVTLRNVGYSSSVEQLPILIQAGTAYRIRSNLLIAADMVYPFYEPLYGSIGAEYAIRKKIYISGGIQIKQNPMLSLGFGYRYRDMQLKVSYTPTLAFYNMISVSFTYSFGEYKKLMLEREVEEKLLETLELYRAGHYEEALVVVDEVLELDPENGRAGSLKHTIEIQLEIREKFGEVSDDVESNEG